MQKIEEILDFIKQKETNVKKLSNESGISSDRIYSWRQGRGVPKAEDTKKLIDWAKKYSTNANKVEEIPAQSVSGKEDFTTASMNAIFNLTESNKILADSHKILAETNKKLADKIISSTAPVQKENSEVFDSRLMDLAGLLADIGSGKRFASRKEALIAIHNVLNADLPEVTVNDIRNS